MKRIPKKRYSREKKVHEITVEYLALQFPQSWFKTDQSGVQMAGKQAKHTHNLSSLPGFPDLTLYESRLGYNALYLELKKEGEELITTKNGTKREKGEWTSDHITNQAAWIAHLNSIGLCATFSIGSDHTRQIIDAYMTENLPFLESLLIRNKQDVARFINSPLNQAQWQQRKVAVHRQTVRAKNSRLGMRQQNF